MTRYRTLLVAFACLAGHGTLQVAQAQRDVLPAADTLLPGSTQALDAGAILALPVDSIDGALLLLPGIGPARDGGLSLRGGSGAETARYIDGVPVSPGTRRMRLGTGTNATAEARVVQGPLPAWAGNAAAGVVALTTPRAAGALAGSVDFRTDRFAGASKLGFNRLGIAAAGPLSRTGRFFLSGIAQGQASGEFGAGARAAPIFVPAGVDTTVAVPTAVGDPLADTTFVDVPTFAIARGECDFFQASVNPGIASNYGLDCRGDRTPASMRSLYRAAGGFEVDAGQSARLSVTAFLSRDQARRFDYDQLYNPGGLFGEQSRSAAYTATVASVPGARQAWRFGLSRQSDRLLAGPLRPQSELDTRTPSAGLLLSGFEFRHDFESFPVDSQLIVNYRNNVLGSRRSPYDLEHTDQYRFIDQYRNNAYGVTGFVERGGPLGAITLLEERRTVAFGEVAWQTSSTSRVTLGGEQVRYAVDSYDHVLTGQAFSGVFRESPRRLGLYAQNVLAFRGIRLSLGMRYDRFDSRAGRPYALDTVAIGFDGSPSETFGTYRYFPRHGSYGNGTGTFTLGGRTLDLVTLVRDEAHSAWSPRVSAEIPVGRAAVRAGLARHASIPDFAVLFAGINTDLSITGTSMLYGTDLDIARSTVLEMGLRYHFTPATALDISAYQRDTDREAVPALLTAFDPASRGAAVGLATFDDVGERRYRGIDARVEHRAGPLLGIVGYAFQDGRRFLPASDFGPEVSLPSEHERPHALSILLGFDAARDPARRGPLAGSAAWIAFRYYSGTPSTPCLAAGDQAVGVPCTLPALAFGALPPFGYAGRLPSYRQLDFRLVRRLSSGRRAVSLYLDTRNLLNTRNLVRVFQLTGTTDAGEFRAGYILEVRNGLESEALRNGAAIGGGAVDLQFAGQGAAGCAGWVSTTGAGLAPNCVALIRAEQRYGNGDGIYDLDEQGRAAGAAFDASSRAGVADSPRRMRLGVEVRF